ncbi:MAG: hypothetical protein GXP17_08290 [Gammaproteobacteria bacterium]|nr:hypothetical protein [Gammaproteobacteria bacterium]
MMNTNLQLILPSLVLPLGLSMLWAGFSRHYSWLLWGQPLLWLPAYFWILGGEVPLLPEEASHWLWLLVLSSMLLLLGKPADSRPYFQWPSMAQIILLAVAIVILSRPVLQYELSLALGLELLLMLGVGAVLLVTISVNRAATPALTLAVSSSGLALVTALGGSVLVGQLAGALASVLGVFAVGEIYTRFGGRKLSQRQLVPVLQVYLALLLIARVYAEIPLPSMMLLLAAPLLGWLIRGRFAVIGSAVASIAALVWLLTTADNSSYY